LTSEKTELNQSFDLKGSMITIPVLVLKNPCTKLFATQLQAKINQSPKLLKGTPMVIDLKALSDQDNLDFPTIVATLRAHDIMPVAIRNGTEPQASHALNAGLGHLAAKASTRKEKISKNNTTMMINKPVRSGQQIYAKNTDLIILGSVSSAAEVMADGNIIVYGTLNGRAMAGVSGDQSARILCSVLRADLVAIAGQYKIRDELEDKVVPQSPFGTQVFLDKQHLCIQKI
jgi:septum site-determining protein MinC